VGTINFENINLIDEYADGMPANDQAQLAKVLFTKELAKRLAKNYSPYLDSMPRVYAVHPGVVRTAIFDSIHDSVGSTLFDRLTRPLSSTFFKTPRDGAKPIVHCAVSKEAQSESGLYYEYVV